MNKLLSAYPVTIDIPIAWGDMDAFQHVNNTVYFRHFESVRLMYFETIGFIEVMERSQIGPILAATQCTYKIPLTYPDRVSVGASVDRIDADRFTMKYATISHRHRKLAASGEGTIVTFDYANNKKAMVPNEVKERIVAIEKQNGELGGA